MKFSLACSIALACVLGLALAQEFDGGFGGGFYPSYGYGGYGGSGAQTASRGSGMGLGIIGALFLFFLLFSGSGSATPVDQIILVNSTLTG